MDEGRGILALMGSGETSPTMVTLHRELAAHMGGDHDAVILETPYGFQVNRDDISTRAREYFRKSVKLTTEVAPYEEDTRPYLEHIPTASGRSAGPEVRHDDFFAPEPADPAVRVRVGREAAAFFQQHLG